jgi:uncharacterized protein
MIGSADCDASGAVSRRPGRRRGGDGKETGVMGNPLCHWELMVSDVKKAKAFYGKVFEWKFDDKSMPGYTVIQTGREPGGGMMAKPPEAPCCALSQYFLVEDIEKTLAKAVKAGGKVAVPKTPIPGVGSFAMLLDPDGICVGIFRNE